MLLDILQIKAFKNCFEDIERVVITPDIKLLTIYKSNNSILITCVNAINCDLTILNVKSFSWMEDNYHERKYKLLVVDVQNEIALYEIEVLKQSSPAPSIVISSRVNWKLKTIFHFFQELSKATENVTSIDILKFEAREAIFLLNNKIVVSLFPSSHEPQVLSFTDISEGSHSYRKVYFLKEILFALNDVGTKLSVYSFSNNTKLCEMVFTDYNIKLRETGSVINFLVSLNLDKILLVTQNHQIFSMSIELQEFMPKLTKELENCAENSFITAFTKQYPSVKRLDKGLRRYSTTSGSTQPVKFSDIDAEFTFKDICFLDNKFCFLLHTSECSILGIHLLDTECTSVFKKTHKETFFIHGGYEEGPFPLLLLCENRLSLILYEIEQDKLINELMVYPSGGAVETLAVLNNWMNIQMDIEVLRLGLRNRQLYTVEFYLKTLLEDFSQQWKHPCSQKWIEKVEKECALWNKIMNLLLDSVSKNLIDLASCQFAEQLLQVSISIVIQVLHVVSSKDVEKESVIFSDKKENILLLFSTCLKKMRKILQEQALYNVEIFKDNTNVVTNPFYTDEVISLFNEWEDLHPEEVMRQSILNCNIPLAQAFFSVNQRDEVKGTYEEFESALWDFVMDYLRQSLMPEALALLLNMGIEINSKLKEIFYSTSEKDIRCVIQVELEKRTLLTSEDRSMLSFVSILERLFPCSSFEHARQLLNEQQHVPNSIVCASPVLEDTLSVGDFVVYNQDNSESSSYCRIVLNWLEAWNKETRERIISPHILKQSPTLDIFRREENTNCIVSSQSMWLYLLENGDFHSIMKWLNTWLGICVDDSPNIFSLGFELNADMINIISEVAPYHVVELALNELARHGVFCEDELEDFSLILRRIGHASCDINDASVFNTKVASISFSELWHRIVHYCLNHQLYKVLYTFMEKNHHRLTSWPVCHFCDVSLLKMMKTFCLWSHNLNDCRLTYDAIIANAQYSYKLQQGTPEEILMNLSAPMNIAVLLFSNSTLSEVFFQLDKGDKQKQTLIMESLKSYPLLTEQLFKNEEHRLKHSVTIYELLKGNSVFDTTLLFGWQSTNTLKSEDARNELPHFSLSSLSEQYGLKSELNYIFYLMEGRPHYSYLKFIAQELVSESGLSNSRIKSVCHEVTDNALSNYRSVNIGAASVSFLELLGHESLPLRLSLLAANILHENHIQNLEEDMDKSNFEIARMLKQSQVKKESATNLVSSLEKITFSKWSSNLENSNSLVADIILWVPLMSIAYLFGVECGNNYLVECAKENKWLQFLIFAEIFQLPKEQVLKAAMKFSDSCITYHVFNALQKQLSSDNNLEAKSRKTSQPIKDIRKSWLSHIGFTRGSNEGKEISRASDILDDEKISICSGETSSSSDIDLGSLLPKDLFGLLLLSHKTNAPWTTYKLLQTSIDTENPVLSLLAALYTDCDLVSCFFTWLYTNLCHDEICKEQLETLFPPSNISPRTEDELEKIIVLTIKNHKILFLWQGIKFFIPDTPLLPLLEALKMFFVHKKFGSSIERFQNHLWDYSSSQGDLSPLNSLRWIESISVRILLEAVLACGNSYESKILLRHYSLTRVEKSFSEDVVVPPFMKVCQMVQFLDDCEEITDLENFLNPKSHLDYENSCWKTVKRLLKSHSYNNAQMFAGAANLPIEAMLLLQANQESEEARKGLKWTNLSFRIQFWKKTLQNFVENNVPIPAIINFLETHIDASDKYSEKYFLGKSIIELLKTCSTCPTKYDLDVQEKKTWWWCIKAEIEGEISPEIFDDMPQLTFNIRDVHYSPESSLVPHNFNEREKEAVGNIIKHFLSSKNLHQAFHLATTFGYVSPDVQTIHCCLQLAKEEIEPCSVDISKSGTALEIYSSRVIRSLVSWITNEYAGITAFQKETIQCMMKVCQSTPVAAAVCHQILVHYTIAAILDISYVDVAEEKDIFVTLRHILLCKLNDDHVIAKSLVVVHDLLDKDVAKFFSVEIWSSLQLLSASENAISTENSIPSSQEILYNPTSTNKGFQMIVKIVQDLSLLGKKLMGIYTDEAQELTPKCSDSTFTSLVDLCICAHDCFTSACHVEGISQILHTSHQLINVLIESRKFTIVIKLLTGIGRYSEMMYVFDILKKHDRFHLLLEEKTEKVHNLRLALLDYLKRYPPSESDGYYYNLTKKLGMHREKAEILEMAAQKELSRLCKRAIEGDLREKLEVAMQDLANAARSYCEADCLHQAQMCAELAELVALQIYLLSLGIWIIGLDETSVSRFITEHSKFSQAFIIAQAYKHHQSWNQAIFINVIIKGDREYLQEFQAQFGLSASNVKDCVKKFKQYKNANEGQIKNIKYLISLCPNVKVKYDMANELGFDDMTSELLVGEDRSYLQDLKMS